MKIAKTMWALVAGGSLLVATVAQAVPITGGISLSGGYSVNTGVLGTATAFSSFTGVTVAAGPGTTGDYAVVPGGTGVAMTPFTFSPFGGSVVPLWTFTFAAKTYSFDLTALSIDLHTSSSLQLSGTGMLHITGLDDTAGAWVFTANSLGGTFSFSSSNGALPDGGTTAMLLGSALAALGVLRRYIKA